MAAGLLFPASGERVESYRCTTFSAFSKMADFVYERLYLGNYLW